ncbi:glycosyltransferase family 2 protein [Methylobacterium oryzae CBMB20]
MRVIAERTNHGFAGGNAVALEHARGAAILLLNPDAFLHDPDALSGPPGPSRRAPGCRGGRPAPDLPGRDASGRRRRLRAAPALDPGARRRAVEPLRAARLYLAGRQARGRGPSTSTGSAGPASLLRRSAIAAIGGLQSPMFLYGEDVDWGCRLRDAGLRVAYRPDIAVTHLQGGSGSTRSARWLDGLAAIYGLRNAGRPLSSPAFFSAPLRLGFTLRALAYGLAARLRGQPDLARKAEDMRRFAGHLRSLRPWSREPSRPLADEHHVVALERARREPEQQLPELAQDDVLAMIERLPVETVGEVLEPVSWEKPLPRRLRVHRVERHERVDLDAPRLDEAQYLACSRFGTSRAPIPT